MIKVNNRRAVTLLSNRGLRAQRLRNLIAVIAIALTATMFMSVFTISGSIVDTMQDSTMRQVGTSAHGGFKLLTRDQWDVLREDPQVKELSYNIMIASAENPELNKTPTEIRWTEEAAAEWSFSAPTTGRLPESGLELCTSTAVLDALGLPHELGVRVPLTFTVHGKTYQEIFTLCGYYEVENIMAISEAYVSREYCDRVAPVIQTPLYESGSSDYAGTINPSFYFSSSWDIEKQVADLKERCGFDERVAEGVNWAYATSSMDVQSVLMLAVILLLVLFSGYLIIYNVFYISVSRDIRFYGLLKTIGTTGRQLKKIVRRQAFLLCLIGIPLGLVVGWLCGRALLPFIMEISAFSEEYVVSADPLLWLGTILFSLLTVWISCIRPCRLAARVSPIEAVRYHGGDRKPKRRTRRAKTVTPFAMGIANLRRDRKKTVLVVISLTLSMILLNGTYTLVNGFDMDQYLKSRLVTDFMVRDASLDNVTASVKITDGVNADERSEIAALPGLEGMGSVYLYEYAHFLDDSAYETVCDIAAEMKAAGDLPSPYADESLRRLEEEHQVSASVYGVDAYLWDKIEQGEGLSLDTERFAGGEYVIVNDNTMEEHHDSFYQPGDSVTLDFGNGNTKQYTVLTVGNLPYCLGPQYGSYLGVEFILPSSEYLRQMGDVQALNTCFDVDEAHTEETETFLKSYCENSNLSYLSRAVYEQEFTDLQLMFSLVGGVLGMILGLIGILNFVGAVINSILSRRREFAMLQAVGMTGGQLKRMLMTEGVFYTVLTLFFAATVGNVLFYAAIQILTREMDFFTYHVTLLPLFVSLPFLLIITLFVPLLANRVLSRQSVVERLRDVD